MWVYQLDWLRIYIAHDIRDQVYYDLMTSSNRVYICGGNIPYSGRRAMICVLLGPGHSMRLSWCWSLWIACPRLLHWHSASSHSHRSPPSRWNCLRSLCWPPAMESANWPARAKSSPSRTSSRCANGCRGTDPAKGRNKTIENTLPMRRVSASRAHSKLLHCTWLSNEIHGCHSLYPIDFDCLLINSNAECILDK